MSIAESVERATAYLTEQPDEARDREIEHYPVTDSIMRAVPVELELRRSA